jgi:hypothetical protein
MVQGNAFFAVTVMILPMPVSSREDRLMRKARKIRARLGVGDDLTEPILFKPKNMYQKTFDRLRKEEKHANDLSLVIVGQKFGWG